MQANGNAMSTLEANTLVYWSLSRGFHIKDAPTVSVQKAFELMNTIQSHTYPHKKLYARIEGLRHQIITGNQVQASTAHLG